MSDSPATPTPHAGEQPGATIGRYKLLEKIGEGGMGTIWLAEQREPVKRRVALKIIKLGMDTKQVIARFDAERQALALMDHPHIAKVFDAGATESGRPYFVMEFIKGVPIVEYCDRERLDMKARLDLFTKVCHAIQHAHHKGIIHRDIKPTNVLVTMMDGAPIPKVIDFGIAKATNSELTTKTLFTEHRQMIGTPAYMSPEQAEMSALDIDTRSDVYSLGVLLYEILTGTTPFDTKSLLESGYAEMMRVIREDEPHTPSRRISSLGDTGTRTAQQRQVDVKRLGAQLRGDLDWIVMKCLEKDRTRRYETANGLAADVQRHLHSEPVEAGPPGAGYKLQKFVRRNRGMVAATAVIAVALVLGAAGTTTGLVRALDEKVRADGEADNAKRAAESEAAAKDDAQRNERDALAAATSAEAAQKEEESARKRAEAINEFVLTTLRAGDAVNPGGGQDVTILAAMDRAIADLDSGRFKDDPATEAALKGTIGLILVNNGRSREAEVLIKQAVESERRLATGDSPGLSRALNNLALAVGDLGRREEARLLFVQALEMTQRLFPGDDARVALGMKNLGHFVGNDEGEALQRQALAMNRRLFSGDSNSIAWDLSCLGDTLAAVGRTAEAEALFAEALTMGRRVYKGDHTFVADALDNLGKARQSLGRPAEAVELLTDALEMRRRLFRGDHTDLATGLQNLAAVLKAQGRLAEAEPLCVQALEMRRRLIRGDHTAIAVSLTQLGDILLRQNRSADAAPHFVEAMEMYRRLELRDNMYMARTLNHLGKGLQGIGRPAEAEEFLLQSLAMRERLFKGDHAELAMCLNDLAGAQVARKRFAEAEATQRKSLEMFKRLFPGDHHDVALGLQNLAVTFRDMGRPAQAEPFEMQALEMSRRLSPGGSPDVATAIYTLGTIREAASGVAEALPLYEAALEMDRKHLPAGHWDLLGSMVTLASAYYQIDSIEKAIPLFEEALKAYETTLGRKHPQTVLTIGNLGSNYKAVGRDAEAVPLLEEAWKSAKGRPELQFAGLRLLDAYVDLADPAKEGSTERAMALLDELLTAKTAKLTKESPELAQELGWACMRLLPLRAWDAAERLLREALAIREKVQPDQWTTFNTRSMLGEALLGQKRYADAEPLLLEGYRGMKEREPAVIEKEKSALATRIVQALERLVKFYEAQGNASEAAAWSVKLEAARATAPKPNRKGR